LTILQVKIRPQNFSLKARYCGQALTMPVLGLYW
jgi:hypothetical protein